MNPRLFAALAVLISFGSLAKPAIAAVPSVATLAPGALHAGQLAKVRTVFVGDSIETFEAEIIGVLPGGRAGGDMILARATSERVIRSGVAQGMSGSPVYVDGKLIGALSSGWQFSKEPIFGITPIGEMLAVLDLAETAHPEGTAGPTGIDPLPGASPRFREYRWDEDEAPALPTPLSLGRPFTLALPLAAGGLHPDALGLVSAMFSAEGFTVTPGGGRVAKAAKSQSPRTLLQPGAAVAVDVLRGDLNLSAIGTVTYRDGDRVLIFGHPFFQAGEIRLPLSTAHITTILANLANSFKLGAPGVPVGTATQDRRAAVGGRLGPVPMLMPFGVTVEMAGRPVQRFRFESIQDRQLAPQLISTAAVNSVLESGGTAAQQTIRWTLDVYRGGRPLHLNDIAASEAPFNDVITGVVGPLRFLWGSPFARVQLDSVALRMKVEPGRAQWTLRTASLDRATVRPGSVLKVKCELERWRGPRQAREVSVAIPEELPDGRYVLWLGGGSESDRFTATRLPARFRPASIEEAWDRLASFKSSDALYSALWARAPEITTGGRDYPELPASTMAVMSAPQTAGDQARRGEWALLDEQRLAMPGVVRGELLLEVNVESKSP
ncbi:MAG: SpoIVB peptidase S55 domain-containing protein [Candidatus Eisenbacteria bacterium]